MSRKYSLVIPGKERPNLLSLFNEYLSRKVKEEKERWARYARSHKGRVHYLVYDDYGDEYEDEMEQLRRFYGGCFPQSSRYTFDDDDDDYWDEDDYDDCYVDDDGTIIFPNSETSAGYDDGDTTLRPGQYHRTMADMDDYWDKLSKFNEGGKKKKHKHSKHRGRRGKGCKVIDINQPYDANYIDDGHSGDALDDCQIYFYEDYHDKYNRVEFCNLYEFDKYCKENGLNVPAYVAEQIAYSQMSHCCLNPQAKEQGELEVMRGDTYGDMFYEAFESCEIEG